VVVEAQQRAIDKDPDQPLRNLSIDAGAMRVRRIIDDMISSKRRTAAA
jgi:vanillate O-demethylase monooxygenase subunit